MTYREWIESLTEAQWDMIIRVAYNGSNEDLLNIIESFGGNKKFLNRMIREDLI